MIRFLLLSTIVLFAFGCNKVDRILGNKPYLELSGSKPYELKITDFTWSYGLVGINQYNGDFEGLDKKVFDLLKGKQGSCKVYLESKAKDQYGKESSEFNYIGDLDLDELNKYEDWEFWHKSVGIVSLLNHKYELQNTDSTAVDTVENFSAVQNLEVQPEPQPNVEPKTFSLGHEDLYPDPDDRANHDYQSYTKPISGVIKAADFYHGTLEVACDDGDYRALRLIPDNLPTSLKSDVRYFMKAGNKIQCVCTVAGARELEIVQVKFTEL